MAFTCQTHILLYLSNLTVLCCCLIHTKQTDKQKNRPPQRQTDVVPPPCMDGGCCDVAASGCSSGSRAWRRPRAAACWTRPGAPAARTPRARTGSWRSSTAAQGRRRCQSRQSLSPPASSAAPLIHSVWKLSSTFGKISKLAILLDFSFWWTKTKKLNFFVMSKSPKHFSSYVVCCTSAENKLEIILAFLATTKKKKTPTSFSSCAYRGTRDTPRVKVSVQVQQDVIRNLVLFFSLL